MTKLKEWIRLARERGASDLHLESGGPMVLRVRGELQPMGEAVPTETLLQLTRELLDATQWQEFLARRSADLSRTLSNTRCRINIFQTVRGMGLAVRLLSSFQNNLKDCNLHPDLRRLITARNGLVIVSGSTGSGKSTTLAALIEEINATQRRHVIVIESPIEYFFTNRKSFIRQREVPSHSPSFEQAIVDSMRENPDILVIGEMRTPDVMRLTLNAAETGHLVLATMHSSTCAEALTRICMSFPAEIQGSIRGQLADSLVGVVCQRLDYLPQLQMRVPQCEVLFANSAVKSNIRTGQFSQILTAIQAGGDDGMMSFDRYQRWMEQKKDWIKQSQVALLEEDDNTLASIPVFAEAKRPAPAQPAATRTKSAAPVAKIAPSQEGRIEIRPIDEDLEGLAQKITGDE
ncbi:MAG: Flp pilus assembly complex ATPase component TadA [Deltaproteobacteria bacterium]|nr:Flp pilus assembly complex ATPase component TadA [Deltaproteobacteria bacterium]